MVLTSLAESLGCEVRTLAKLPDAELLELYNANAATERLCTLVGSSDVEAIAIYCSNARR